MALSPCLLTVNVTSHFLLSRSCSFYNENLWPYLMHKAILGFPRRKKKRYWQKGDHTQDRTHAGRGQEPIWWRRTPPPVVQTLTELHFSCSSSNNLRRTKEESSFDLCLIAHSAQAFTEASPAILHSWCISSTMTFIQHHLSTLATETTFHFISDQRYLAFWRNAASLSQNHKIFICSMCFWVYTWAVFWC